MDLGILFGFLGTWVLIVWAIFAGGNVGAYVNPPGMILVIGTSLCVLFISFPAKNLKQLFGVAKQAVVAHNRSIDQLIEDLVSYAEIARRDGILSLENSTKDIDDPFIVRGIQMAVDGTDPELIEQIMSTELENTVERHEQGKGMFESLGKYAPAFGMIGTLVGLVAMLSDLEDPAQIGSGMAIALLTTMYGAMIANGVALPIADRLGQRSADEILYKTIIIKGVMAIQSGDNPRIVDQKLRTFLPPSLRPSEDEEDAA